MHNGETLTYSNVEEIDEDSYQFKIYRPRRSLLAALSRGDVKNLITKDA